MSLDVYLTIEGTKRPKGSGIWVRENGQTVEITREEWDCKFPNREPVVAQVGDNPDPCVFNANITHNLSNMAEEAGIYMQVWRPDECGIDRAEQLIPVLERGIALMESDPGRFEKHNAPNGWGVYDDFLPWLKRYLEACKESPTAKVSVSR